MENTKFFEQLLGIRSPWYITDISQNHKEMRIDIYVKHSSGIKFPCPECDKFCSVYDHTTEREFRHLNVFQMSTYIHVRIPRIECDVHGVQTVVHGLADPNSTVTYDFESFVIDLQKECSIESICRLLQLNWHSCYAIQEKAVNRGLKAKPKVIPQHIGVDEKSFAKGHKYETIVYNNTKGNVEYVGDNRGQCSLEEYYKQFDDTALKTVQSITMDMWDPFIAATKAYIPDAENKIVFDRFHVMKQVTEAVDKVRRQEHAIRMKDHDNILKGTKYLWLWNRENIPEFRIQEFEDLQSQDLKVSRAWAIKENLRNLWSYKSVAWMRKYFEKWYYWATHSRLTPIKKAAKTLNNHIDNIVTYAKHKITNALGEGINAKIEKVKRLACGYRNQEHYRHAIYFHCGGLELYSVKPVTRLQIMG
jgi:transposase